ncbi:MAG: Filamentation induced by cAMP protein Fic [Candidatus Woesebacteria bacterium GW2011_GWB1_41_10]|uniref:Filamentation induced by cAMP protein Fic n=1 Tax=Candidatus Woesebacteria bacterium GW2011_GWB1_41_10 TaxID=1618577 RepID=A0A0G0WP78_9BACT|nr:MAG: Filamentation induced by cAMP protein Fic [Candidatus Woesebacteria bacterium GW2011_GWB1_41_10]
MINLKTISPDILSLVAKIDELKGMWTSGVKLHPQVLKKLKESVLVTSTGASTRIEGAKMSDEDIEKLLRGISMEKFADRDKQEVRGYFELLENIFHSWQDIYFNESSIKHFHKELLKYAERDKLHRGEYKKSENKVHMIDAAGNSIGVLFDTAPSYLAPSKTKDLIDWTQNALKEKKYHPLLTIGIFLVHFLQIHPFQDGNGRLSRILTNFLLLKEGYVYVPYVSHEKIIEDNKPEYYLALRTSQRNLETKEEDVSAWLLFFLKAVLKQSQEAINLLSDENIEKTFSKKQLAVWEYLKTAQEITPLEIIKKLEIPRRTINQILDKLLKIKRVERIGMGRSTRYKVL